MVKHIEGLKFLITGGTYNINGKEITVKDQVIEIKRETPNYDYFTVDRNGVPKEIML